MKYHFLPLGGIFIAKSCNKKANSGKNEKRNPHLTMCRFYRISKACFDEKRGVVYCLAGNFYFFKTNDPQLIPLFSLAIQLNVISS